MNKVLLVEDDSNYAMAILRVLRATHFQAFLVSTLSQAIEEFKKNGFKAVLLDVGLPDSDKERTVKRMKTEYPNCAIVVLSGYEDPDHIKRCIADSASSYLIKGRDDQNPEMLEAALKEAISSNSAFHKAVQVKDEIESSTQL